MVRRQFVQCFPQPAQTQLLPDILGHADVPLDEGARFCAEVQRDASPVSADGYDRVEFVVQTNPGSRPGPLMKVASGGELSRFLLALKVSLAERDTAPTLVFDEIDTGVGGAVADAIGQRLARLAAKAQVLAVTHAPQVAARSQPHFKIVKDEVGAGERVATRVIDRARASDARRSRACWRARKSPRRRGRLRRALLRRRGRGPGPGAPGD